MKSAIVTKLNEWADTRALKITNFEAFANDMDKLYDLEPDGTIVRKDTAQIVGEFNDSFARTVLRPVINDKSFGQFRSAFPERAPTDDEKSKTNALLLSSPFVFSNTEKAEKLKGWVLNNFVPSGDRLHRLYKGHTSTQSFTVAELLTHYGSAIINSDKTMIKQLEAEADIREYAQHIAPNEESFNRVHEIVKRDRSTRFDEIPAQRFADQQIDLHKKALSFMGMFDERDATLSETNRLAIQQKFFQSEIDQLPTINLDTL